MFAGVILGVLCSDRTICAVTSHFELALGRHTRYRLRVPSAELMTVTEMAQLLRTTERAVRQRAARGSVPAHLVVPDVKPMLFYALQVREWLGLDVTQAATND